MSEKYLKEAKYLVDNVFESASSRLDYAQLIVEVYQGLMTGVQAEATQALVEVTKQQSKIISISLQGIERELETSRNSI